MNEETKPNSTKKVRHIVNDPKTNAATAPKLKLYRPTINYWKALIFLIVHLTLGIIISFFWTSIERNNKLDAFLSFGGKFLFITLILFCLTLRFILIWLVRLYQRYARAETRLRCCMTPSCSEYAILSFKKYGAIWGGIKTVKRLRRCHPPGEIDFP